MERRRRIGAYGVCRDAEGRVLLVRAARGIASAGRWFLPGGGVEHGEHPADAVARECAEETGLLVRVDGIRDVLTDIDHIPDIPAMRHHDRLIFDARVVGGHLRDETGGSSDRARWVGAEEYAELLPLMPFVARVLGARTQVTELTDFGQDFETTRSAPTQIQRFATYGLVSEPAGDVLLTLIAEGYPGAGLWHLPGGGTDFGETATDGLLRELAEETNQQGRITGLIDVSHRHHRGALGPEGVPVDFHAVRVIFNAMVDGPTPPRVMEPSGGSTAAAAWIPPARALRLPLTDIAHEVISRHVDGG